MDNQILEIYMGQATLTRFLVRLSLGYDLPVDQVTYLVMDFEYDLWPPSHLFLGFGGLQTPCQFWSLIL